MLKIDKFEEFKEMNTQDLCQRQYCVLQQMHAIRINEFNFTIATVKTNVK